MNISRILAFLFSFQGRLTRLQWWIAQLILVAPCLAIANILPDENATASARVIVSIALIPILWIDLATSAKRYHDINRSGWRQLLSLIPIIGEIWVLVELGFIGGANLPNQYGYPGVFGKETVYSRGNEDK